MLSIPSTKNDDPNYRYKMPRLIAKVEGRGNGIRTNVVNMGDIARALKRPPDYPTRFCGSELGAQSKFDPAERKAILTGAHEQQDLQLLIDKFIVKFVLCQQCELPEIDLMVKKGRVQYHCNACGSKGDVDNTHRLASFIVKNPPDGGSSTMGANAKKKTKEERRSLKNQKQTTHESDDESDTEERGKSSKKKSSSKKKAGKQRSGEDTFQSVMTEEGAGANDLQEDTLSNKSGESCSQHDGVNSNGKKKKGKQDKSAKKPGSKSTKSNGDTNGSRAKATDTSQDDRVDYAHEDVEQTVDQLLRFICHIDALEASDQPDQQEYQIDDSITPQMFYHELRQAQIAKGFDQAVAVYTALRTLFHEKLDGLTAGSLEARLKYLAPVAKYTLHEHLITALQDFIFLHGNTPVFPDGVKAYPGILYAFYDKDLLNGEDILEFYASSDYANQIKQEYHGSSGEAYLAAYQAAQSILDWLKVDSN